LKVFDIETNGLLDAMDRVHLLVIKDTTRGTRNIYRRNDEEDTICSGLSELMEASRAGEIIVGHNIIKFDIPAIKLIYPSFEINPKLVLDTLVLARALFPDIKTQDARLIARGALPKKYFRKQSLESWGYRLGVMKGEYGGDTRIADEKLREATKWERWNPDMEVYGDQDVVVTEKLLDTLLTGKRGSMWFKPTEVDAVRLEHDVQWIIARQERFGFCFDEKKAVTLYASLTKTKLELESKLNESLPFLYLKGDEFTPKTNNRTTGCVKGATFTRMKFVPFNPGSRDHVAILLKRKYDWKPEEFTDDGKAKIDETILGQLKYPEAKLLSEYFMVEKRIGQIATGKEAWLKHVGKDGRIHGGVVTNGAVTGRMTHSHPNLAQVPAGRSPYGHECRELFHVPPNKRQVGADADALELRCLAHFMAKYDGGAYIKVVLEGRKENGTDIHSVNARALGMDPKAKVLDGWTGRDLAKTWFYAFIYGAGDGKLGCILTGLSKDNPKAKKLGKKSRDDFMTTFPRSASWSKRCGRLQLVAICVASTVASSPYVRSTRRSTRSCSPPARS
jgi:DNA polymerase-1